jgi:hypothetical protein
MFNNIRGSGSKTLITKLATALVSTGKKLCSSHSLYNPNDMANIANARRNVDDYMRRGVQSGGEESSSSSGNFKCEITKKNKRTGEIDCNCEFVCMAKVSETMLIHQQGQQGKREEEKK